ncbi:MAG: hypothetical protein NZL98_05685, partial [Anaerolineales bacterium]|nr:hypothetical protein [Anaerolineales bacterium]
WKARSPFTISLPSWMPSRLFDYAPTWQVDDISWPYAFVLSTIALATILTSVARNENHPAIWAGSLALTALGLLAVSAGDPITLLLIWAGLDLVELALLLRSGTRNGGINPAIHAYGAQTAGLGSIIIAVVLQTAQGLPRTLTPEDNLTGLFLLLGASLRLGILPLHLPYRSETSVRRGFGTILRLVSAAASLSLLGRLPNNLLSHSWAPFLSILLFLPALYGAWMWLRASDEILGRPFWIISLASLAALTALQGNPTGSIGWGIALLGSGTALFLYSARARSIFWLPATGVWGLSALPFSPTASVWSEGHAWSWLLWPIFVISQAFLLAGFLRHALHPGEMSFESQQQWSKILYPAGLFFPAMVILLLGFWGWKGANSIGHWPLGLTASILGIVIWQAFRARLANSQLTANLAELRLPLHIVSQVGAFFLKWLGQLARTITFLLEGEGGQLWAILVLVILLSLVFQGG